MGRARRQRFRRWQRQIAVSVQLRSTRHLAVSFRVQRQAGKWRAGSGAGRVLSESRRRQAAQPIKGRALQMRRQIADWRRGFGAASRALGRRIGRRKARLTARLQRRRQGKELVWALVLASVKPPFLRGRRREGELHTPVAAQMNVDRGGCTEKGGESGLAPLQSLPTPCCQQSCKADSPNASVAYLLLQRLLGE